MGRHWYDQPPIDLDHRKIYYMKIISKITGSILLVSIVITSASANTLFMGSPQVTGSDTCTENCVSKWTSSVELGFVSVSGNTETDTFNGRFSLGYEKQKWRHGGFLATQFSSTNDKRTNTKTDAEKLTAQIKSDYQYSKFAYAFGIIDYDETKDSGFDYQSSYAIGAGYRFIKSDAHRLDGEFGFGVRNSKAELTQLTNSELISRIAGFYKWQISKTSKIEQSISSEIGTDNTIIKYLGSLSANVLDSLALKVSYALKHQSEVPVGNERKETVTSFTVVYSF